MKVKIHISAYTNPKNCTDKTDVECGISYCRQSIMEYQKAKRKVPSYLYGRLHKLHIKLSEYEAI